MPHVTLCVCEGCTKRRYCPAGWCRKHQYWFDADYRTKHRARMRQVWAEGRAFWQQPEHRERKKQQRRELSAKEYAEGCAWKQRPENAAAVYVSNSRYDTKRKLKRLEEKYG